MNIFSSFFVLVVCSALVACKEVKFKDCGSSSGKPTHLYIEPCTADPCELIKGSNSSISISFIPSIAVKSVKASVHGIIAGIPIPFPLPKADGCKNCGLSCPLKEGVEVKYSKTLAVLSSYPKMKLLVKWELKDQNNKDLICLEMPVQITSK